MHQTIVRFPSGETSGSTQDGKTNKGTRSVAVEVSVSVRTTRSIFVTANGRGNGVQGAGAKRKFISTPIDEKTKAE